MGADHPLIDLFIGVLLPYQVVLVSAVQQSESVICIQTCCAQSLGRVRLFVTPWTVARQALLSMGILQARILEWVAMPSSRGSSQPRVKPRSPTLQVGFFLCCERKKKKKEQKNTQSFLVCKTYHALFTSFSFPEGPSFYKLLLNLRINSITKSFLTSPSLNSLLWAWQPPHQTSL